MIIQCPACGARAKLPDSKEGAKVRCAECERVYLARARGGGSTRSQGSMLPIAIGGGAVALALILFAMTQGGGDAPAPPPEDEPVVEAPPTVDHSGWNSPLVKHARAMHDMASAGSEAELQNEIAFDLAWARTSSEGDELIDPAGYGSLAPAEKLQFDADLLAALMSADPDNLVGQWMPFDGSVLEETDDSALLRLTLQSRDASDGTTRHIDWRLAKTQYGWKAWSWERWFSPEELAADRRGKSASRSKKTLSDGSIVYEAEVEKVDWMPETTAKEREYITGLIETLIDLDSREWIPAQDELKVIGKPAIPGLLNHFADLDAAGWEVEERGMQGQRLHMTLQEITGYVTTFNPHEALGGTDERRESGVKQWFFWYNRKFKRFEGKPEETDLLDELWEPKTDAEKREYEKYKKKIEQEGQGG